VEMVVKVHRASKTASEQKAIACREGWLGPERNQLERRTPATHSLHFHQMQIPMAVTNLANVAIHVNLDFATVGLRAGVHLRHHS
jgi:hypothetical protein